jgi:UDP-glucose 4-epimerase
MQEHDAVIHLAFVVKREGRTYQEMQDVNVRGSSLVVDAAIKNSIKKFINLSSVSVYGSGEDLTETTPLNPSRTFHYAQHKADVERYININMPTAIQLRSHLIMGANAQLFLREMFTLPIWMKFGKNKAPRQQVVHENDVVKAILRALNIDVSGTFNLSAPDVLDLAGAYIKKDRNVPGVPFWMIRYMVRVVQFFKPKDEFTWVEMLNTTMTVNCKKSKSILDWEPRFNAWDARRDAIDSLADKAHR